MMTNLKSILVICLIILILPISPLFGQNSDSLIKSFLSPPDTAKPRVYWWWLFNRVDKAGITRDLEEFKAKGIIGVNLICTGGYAGMAPLPGVKYLSPEWRELFRHAVKEASRLNIELGFNLSAGGWTMEGPWVNKDNAMKKVVSSELNVVGPKIFSGKLPQPEVVAEYYHDIWVQAFRVKPGTMNVELASVIDISDRLKPDGRLDWEVPDGQWVILRNGYTLTGHMWSKWFAYPGPPQADTFEGGDGYEIDYLKTSALDDHFEHLGKPILEEAKKAGGHIAYFWSDSWECGKLTWTQDFPNQFKRFRGYELKPFLPILAGYTIGDSLITARFRNDFDLTIQDCIAENFYGHFYDLCHKNGLDVGNEAGGPNDIPPQDVLKNLGRSDIPAGEFWVKNHYRSAAGYNQDRNLRLNLKQTATASHIYGKKEAMAESFTQQEQDLTHWSLGPSDLKPYANDAFCEGINRIMLHQATCQPPSDGKPGYEFCAGQHWTPNITWWEQSKPFFSFLSRCQYMLQQGKFVGDVCFYLGERSPTLAPPKYIIPSLGAGYDCDYSNAEVLLTRMSVKNGQIVLPDGMKYRLLVLQNCTSPVPEICQQVSSYQKLSVSPEPSHEMSLKVIEKLRQLILDGATVIGPPPQLATGLQGYPKCDKQVLKIASDIWGTLDGKTQTERRLGKGRIIWGKTPREVLLADGVNPDFSYPTQDADPEKFDYIHRTDGAAEIYFVINRTKDPQSTDFTFRVHGKQPEIWNPVTGEMQNVNYYDQSNGSTTLNINLDRFESLFIVFRNPIAANINKKAESNFPVLSRLIDLTDSWKVTFDPLWSGPGETEFPTLTNWINSSVEGIKHYSGMAIYRKTFDLDKIANSTKITETGKERLYLDLGNVRNVAEIRLNGQNLGVLWCSPWRIEITNWVKSKDNKLEIDVINLWANRVIGDLKLPKEKRVTKTHDKFRFDMLKSDSPLLDSGLLGPVWILKSNQN
ncbi:MAG: glycosyl hydrolase [Mariniphaga sp.]